MIERKFMPKTLHLLVTPLCDRDCQYCCNKQYDLNEVPHVTEEELRQVERVFLTGGEPFAYSAPNEIAAYLKRKYKNIKFVAAYANAHELAQYRASLRFVYNLDGLTISVKSEEDKYLFENLIAVDACINREVKSIWVYVFPGYEDTEVPDDMKKINRVWQEEFKPAPNSFFRRL